MRLDHALCRRKLLAAGLTVLLPAAAGPAIAQGVITLGLGEAAIVFMVLGQGRTGDIEVRDASGAPIWDALLAEATVRQFTVRPGAYRLILPGDGGPVGLATREGHVTLVSLVGEPRVGAYRMTEANEVRADQIRDTQLLTFIGDHRVSSLDYAPVVLESHGAGLSFVVRTDY